MRTRTTALTLVGATLVVFLTTAWVYSQPTSEKELRKSANQLYSQGNFKEALALYRRLLTEPRFARDANETDVERAFESIIRLNQRVVADALIEAAAKNNASNWRVLRALAKQYRRLPTQGTIVAGEFQRGVYGRQGRPVNSIERDHARSLQLFEQARVIVERQASQTDAGQFYLDLAEAMLRNRSGGAAWRLQHLTDLETLPDYAEGYNQGSYSAAPVDEDGNPVFHYPPTTWGEAATDGQRWRYALQRAVELNRRLENQVNWKRCQFLESQFAVTTMQYYGWYFSNSNDEDAAKGVLSLQSLGDDETVCRLATGVKRFKLPESHNYLAIYKRMANSDRDFNSLSSDRLAKIYTDRMQYAKAASQWRYSIQKFGGGNSRDRALEQIVGKWGRFEPTMTQPAGQGAELQFKFRNGQRVAFTARRIKVNDLLNDIKKYLSSNPQRMEWQKYQISNLGYRLVQDDQKKYIGEEVANWSLPLKPRDGHFDKRITVATPLQKGGAYLVTAKMEGGNKHSVIIWIADTAVVQKRIDANSLYLFADAATGRPVPNVNVNFFGYHTDVKREGRKRTYITTTKEFDDIADDAGRLIPKKSDTKTGTKHFNWLVVGTTADGRFAHLGFQGIWIGNRRDREFQQRKAFCVTDRPLYRPNETIQFKAWVKFARYDAVDTRSEYAGKSFKLRLHNPKGEKIETFALIADEYGGLEGEYKLPKDAALGAYSLYVEGLGSTSFRVEEYKKPEFEVTVEAPKRPIILGETFAAKVKAKYYFGAPVQNATVKLKVMRSDYDAKWYPYHPWDWYYGPGFWWFASDYGWYPGARKWLGCIGPIIGPRFGFNPPELVLEMEKEIGPDGTVDVEIDSAIAKLMHGDSDHKYTITAEVRDQSRRTIVGQGNVIAARKPFMVYTWLDRGYYSVGDKIRASFKAQTLDSRPIQGKAIARLLKIQYSREGKPTEVEVQNFESETNAQGEGQLDIQAAAPGQYRLSIVVDDGDGHGEEGGFIFTIRGNRDDGSEYHFDSLELIPDKKTYSPGESMQLQINTEKPNSTVYLFLRPVNGVYLPPRIFRLKGKSKVVDVPVTKGDMPNFFVEAITVADGKVHTAVKSVAVPPEKRILNVEVVPDKDEYRPQGKAKLKLHLTDSDGKDYVGTTAVAVYDRALEYIAGRGLNGDIRSYFWKWLRNHYSQHATNLEMGSSFLNTTATQMQPLGAFGNQVADIDRQRGLGSAAMKRSQPQMGMAMGGGIGGGGGGGGMRPAAAMEASADLSAAAGGDDGRLNQSGQMVEAEVRSDFADTAYWVASVETDKNGLAEVEFDMPDNLTSWKVQVWGVGHGARVGSSSTEVVTSKNVIVRLQAPRFFTEKDEAVLSAVVHNYLDTSKGAEVLIETEGPVQLIDAATNLVSIDANGEARVDWRVKIVGEGEAVIRMIAKTDEESDAMELKFPCQVYGAERVQSFVASIAKDESKESIVFNVPLERRADQTRLEVRYSPTLAGAMVDAIPYLADYPYGCTEQTLNRFLPAVITQRTLQRMNLDLKEIQKARTNLNAQEIGDDRERAKQWKQWQENPVFDEALLADMVQTGVKDLTRMQRPSGGWGWFSGRHERSAAHTTVVVLRGLMIARDNDAQVDPAVIQRGLDWLAKYQQAELQKLKNFERDQDPRKSKPDNLDAYVYQVLVSAKRDNREMREWLYRERIGLSVYAKTVFALAVLQMDDQPKLQMLLRNIKQFQVDDDENETSYLDLGGQRWWYWHGDEIEANAMYLKLLASVEPNGETAPRLVKYLLNNRKHASYWKSTRDTALCVEAFADYLKATGELNPEMTVEIWLDGEKRKEVSINRRNLFSYDNQFLVVGDELEGGKHTLEIRRKGKGPVYFNAYLTNFTLEDEIPAAGLEVKVERAYYRLTPKEKKERVVGSRGQSIEQAAEAYDRTPLANLNSLESGDLVEIELKLTSKNDYEYILFEDMKAAGLEPVDLRSGYLSGSGMLVYREFRNNRVGFFMRSLPRGVHSLSYRMRAETPGKFGALPAQAYGMYAPELRGNSRDAKLVIEDKP